MGNHYSFAKIDSFMQLWYLVLLLTGIYFLLTFHNTNQFNYHSPTSCTMLESKSIKTQTQYQIKTSSIDRLFDHNLYFQIKLYANIRNVISC